MPVSSASCRAVFTSRICGGTTFGLYRIRGDFTSGPLVSGLSSRRCPERSGARSAQCPGVLQSRYAASERRGVTPRPEPPWARRPAISSSRLAGFLVDAALVPYGLLPADAGYIDSRGVMPKGTKRPDRLVLYVQEAAPGRPPRGSSMRPGPGFSSPRPLLYPSGRPHADPPNSPSAPGRAAYSSRADGVLHMRPGLPRWDRDPATTSSHAVTQSSWSELCPVSVCRPEPQTHHDHIQPR